MEGIHDALGGNLQQVARVQASYVAAAEAV
jgi:hypothetical protein